MSRRLGRAPPSRLTFYLLFFQPNRGQYNEAHRQHAPADWEDASAEARDVANRLCREEGVYCGMSSGANVAVALRVARTMKKGQNVVTVIADGRDGYVGREVIKAGEFKKGIGAGSDASILVGLVRGLGLHWATTAHDFDWEKIQAQVSMIVLQGILE